jgi:hypothetical protein
MWRTGVNQLLVGARMIDRVTWSVLLHAVLSLTVVRILPVCA